MGASGFPSMRVSAKAEALAARLRECAPLVIAYSGGVDSAYLLAAAHRALGEDMLAVIADSPSLPRQALEEALELARQIGAQVEVIRTDEFANPEYVANPLNRCYFCKAELFAKLERLALDRGFRAIAYGENADDARAFRPGRQAAAEFSVVAPLKELGFTKAEIREMSRNWGLPTADSPAQPCLSSRIPHGTPVSVQALALVEKGELLVRSLGFRIFRVRYMVGEGGVPWARVQIAPEEMERIGEVVTELEEGLRAIGYAAVEIDPAGYQSS